MRGCGRGPLMVLALIAAAVLLQVCPAVYAESITGPVTHIRDGDTIKVAGRPIRFKGLNCADLGTSLGSAGRDAV